MSSSLTHPGAGAGVPSWNFGLAAAGLAVVIAIGVGFAVSQDDAVTVPNARSAHPMVSDAHRAKAELLAERRAESPGANVEKHKVEAGIIGAQPKETFNIEEYRIKRGKAAEADSTWSDQYESYYQFLVERAGSAGN